MMNRGPRTTDMPITVDAPSASGFPSPVVNVKANRKGMAYAMQFQPRVIGAPTVPVQPRSSLAQLIIKHRIQASLYISDIRTNGSVSLPFLAGYPAAKTFKVIPTKPTLSADPTPQTSGRAAAAPGAMKPPPRFRKGLPLPITPFNPPTYQ